MERFHGTAARQLATNLDTRVPDRRVGERVAAPRLRLVEQDLYAELTRRRRRAQIAARRWLADEKSYFTTSAK